ncbi:MAG: hypothetical protein WKF84_18845 [Pyrinomonadaceae bacterium]
MKVTVAAAGASLSNLSGQIDDLPENELRQRELAPSNLSFGARANAL